MDKNKNIRTNLKIFRVNQHLTTEEMANRIGCIRPTYSAIENGKREGRKTFWRDLQIALGLKDDEIVDLMKID